MSVYYNEKRARWMYDFERRGKRYNEYCLDQHGHPVASKRAALEAEALAKSRAALAPKVPRANDLTLATVAADLTAAWQGTKNWSNKEVYLREIIAFFGVSRVIATISEADIEDYITFAQKQPVMIWTGGSSRKRTDDDAARFWKPSGRTRGASTVNRYLPVLRAIFERAYKVRDPITNERAIPELPEFKDLMEPTRRARPVPEGVLSHVLRTLPEHVREAVIATLHFGFRRSEIYRLEIPDVDFENAGIRLGHERVKDHEDAFLPGSADAMAFMRRLVDQAKARGTIRLITWRPYRKDHADQEREPWRTVESPKRAWRTAMKRVLLAFGRRYRWHDIRASFISGVANADGLLIAQKIARHSDSRTTQAYILVEADRMRAAVERASARPALQIIPGEKSRTEAPNIPKPKGSKIG